MIPPSFIEGFGSGVGGLFLSGESRDYAEGICACAYV
jgi:hypothetical protein